VVGAYEYAGGGQSFCAEHFVRLKVYPITVLCAGPPLLIDGPQAMEEMHKLRAQISNIVRTNFADADAGFTPKLPPPQDLQVIKDSFTKNLL
jgi:ATP-dependent RNA helicase DHX37/DHR1